MRASRFLLVVACLATTVLSVHLSFPLLVNAQDDTVSLSGRAGSLFDKGKKEFQRSRWKEAEAFFKDAKKSTDKTSAKSIEPWLKACKGGKKLDKAVAAKNPRKALAKLKKLQKTYGETPLSVALEKAYRRVHRQVYHTLADFEPVGSNDGLSQYLPMGAEYVSAREFVREGSQSIKWRAQPNWTEPASLALGKVSGDLLDRYDYMSFWIYAPDKTLGKYLIVFNIDDVDVLDADGDVSEDCFFRYVTVTKKGWTQVRFDLDKELSKFGSAERGAIKGVHLLMLPFSRTKTIYLDDVKLEKR